MTAKLLALSGVLICGFCTIMAAPPNVVMIIGDDQSWGDFGFMGHPVIRTPHLDRLATESLVYTHGYVSMSFFAQRRSWVENPVNRQSPFFLAVASASIIASTSACE